MSQTVWLLSEEGILDRSGEPLPDVPFKASVVAGDVKGEKAAVIVNNHDVWSFAEGTWNHEVSADVTLNCVCWTDNRLLVGTERARLAWVDDGDLNFIESFDDVPERNLWKTPWGGPPDVRSLAVSTDETIYADIHVGWIVRSKDGGETWKNLRDDLNVDVHEVGTHPSRPAVVFAATAGGFYISDGYGDTFAHQSNGMPYHYQRACACFSERDVYLVSTSRGPHRQTEALLYRTEDAGASWTLVNGLPENITANIDTFQIIIVEGAHALVVVENSDLYETDDWGVNWKKVAHDYPRLYGALVV